MEDKLREENPEFVDEKENDQAIVNEAITQDDKVEDLMEF